VVFSWKEIKYMNIIIYTLVIFGIIYFLLKLLANTSSKKISKYLRKPIFIGSIVLALVLAVGGKFLFSIPLTLLSLAIVKLKGFSIMQLIGLFRLIQTLRRSGRFSFNQNQNIKNSSILSLEEAYKILNLDKNKNNTKDDVNKAYIKIQKKIHPDVSPETTRLSAIVNEAKEVVLKNIS
jgi:flagellar motor component MotA